MSLHSIMRVLLLFILCVWTHPAVAIEPLADGFLFILDPSGSVWGGCSDIYAGNDKNTKRYANTLQLIDKDAERITYTNASFLCTIKKGVAYLTGDYSNFPFQGQNEKKFVRNWKLPITDISMFLKDGPDNILLKRDGTVWTWLKGWGDVSTLGRSISTQEREELDRYMKSEVRTEKEPALYKPTQIPTLHSICKIRMRLGCALALQDDGTLWMWGALGSTKDLLQETPRKILTNVRDMDTDGSIVLAVKNDDTLWVWGYGFYGMVGEQKFSGELIKEPLQVLDNVLSAFPNGLEGAIAYRKDDSIWGWG